MPRLGVLGRGLHRMRTLMQGFHLIWAVKGFQTWVLIEMGRLTEAAIAAEESVRLNPDFGWTQTNKASANKLLGRKTEWKDAMANARRVGWSQAQAERTARRLLTNSPRREDHIAAIGAMYAETE